MKKFKKFFAVLLSLAMVLGMSMTTFAAPIAKNGAINVSGLKAGATVSIYKVLYADANGNAWETADWAKDVTGAVTEDSPVWNIDPVRLQNASEKVVAATDNAKADGTVSFTGLDAGVYLVIAQDTNDAVTYSPMLAVTYNREAFQGENATAKYLEAATANVVAKSSSINVDKETTDKYVAMGSVVDFDITTTFPGFHDANGKNKGGSYAIIDTPTGLAIKADSIKVTVGGTELTKGSDYTATVAANGVMTIDFATNYIGTNNANAGKTVVVEYQAEVTAVTGIKNTAQAVGEDNKPFGDDEEKLFTGSVTITKTDDSEDNALPLAGATFKVYDVTNQKYATLANNVVTGWVDTVEDANETSATDVNGTVTVKGLDADNSYQFIEVKAPDGYSVNTTPSNVTWNAKPDTPDDTNVTGTATMADTKLSGLPSTGGIGTTIFTIGGCAIMIIAAGLFFASRRKSAK